MRGRLVRERTRAERANGLFTHANAGSINLFPACSAIHTSTARTLDILPFLTRVCGCRFVVCENNLLEPVTVQCGAQSITHIRALSSFVLFFCRLTHVSSPFCLIDFVASLAVQRSKLRDVVVASFGLSLTT